jgi:uncharacterized membrane protein
MNGKIATAVAMAALLYGSALLSASADAPKMEKCYGVAKAGKNDCKTNAHACAGKSVKGGERADYLMVPNGLCAKLKGGETVAATTPPAKSKKVKAASAAPAPAAAASQQSWWQKLWSNI